jgi:hypothetical protein
LLLDFIEDEGRRSAAGAASLKRYRDNFQIEVVAPRLYDFLTHSTAPRSPHPKVTRFVMDDGQKTSDTFDTTPLDPRPHVRDPITNSDIPTAS